MPIDLVVGAILGDNQNDPSPDAYVEELREHM